MKKLSTLFVSMIALFSFAGTAMADLFSISADIPVSFAPKADATAKSISGYKVGVSFFVIPIGIGAENYTVTFEGDSASGTPDIDATYNMVDVFFNLPIPVVNIAIGGGAGIVSTSGGTLTSGATYSVDDVAATQFFASFGYEILPLFDIHVGYHSINAEGNAPEVTLAGTTIPVSEKVDYSGSMYSLGVKVGF